MNEKFKRFRFLDQPSPMTMKEFAYGALNMYLNDVDCGASFVNLDEFATDVAKALICTAYWTRRDFPKARVGTVVFPYFAQALTAYLLKNIIGEYWINMYGNARGDQINELVKSLASEPQVQYYALTRVPEANLDVQDLQYDCEYMVRTCTLLAYAPYSLKGLKQQVSEEWFSEDYIKAFAKGLTALSSFGYRRMRNLRECSSFWG